MNTKNMKLPTIIIAVGVIIAIISCFIVGIVKEPVIKERDFEYSVTYKLDGEVKTFDGVFKCSFAGHSGYEDPTHRDYEGIYTENGNVLDSSTFTLKYKDGIELYMSAELNAAYLMGDPDKYEYEPGLEDPYIGAFDQEGIGVEATDIFDIEIISWEYPEPIENEFRFVGFSILHTGSMLAMFLCGVLTIIACAIFVKKEAGVSYKHVDNVSLVLNFLIGFMVIPFIIIAVYLFQITINTEDFIYQAYLCIPALTAFTIAASLVLRRKGFTKSGLLVQFIGPILFFIPLIFESLIYNLAM